jgi:hypothetical protein
MEESVRIELTLDRSPDYGLASRCIPALPTLHLPRDLGSRDQKPCRPHHLKAATIYEELIPRKALGAGDGIRTRMP